MTVDISNRGQRYGYLTVAYTNLSGHKVTCYCVCSKQVSVAVDDLTAGIVTSCGCMPASQKYHNRRAELRAQLQREIIFASALGRSS